jgi:two-component system response regulator YesN
MIGMVIADDEYNIREGLASIPWHDYKIELKGVADNGLDALSIIKRTNPDILLLDIKMPGMNGLDVIQTVKKEKEDIKSILLTG